MARLLRITLPLLTCMLAPSVAFAITESTNAFPGCPEIEALISMHKTLYKDAVTSSEFVAATISPNTTKKSLNEKWQETRAVLDKRLDDASTWVSLTSLLATTSLEVVNLAKELSEFITEGETLIKRNPLSAYYYYQAYDHISSEIIRMRNVVTTASLAQMGVFNGTLQQKANVLHSLNAAITTVRGIMKNTLFKCRWMLGDKIQFVHVRQILQDKELQGFAKSAISSWNKANEE